jgi:hypothetical protein
VVESDFRTESLAEYAYGLELSTTEAPATAVTSAITRLSARVDEWTNDHFEAESLTLDLDGSGTTKLYLPQRCTAVSSVSIRDEEDVYTVQTALGYRLHSSLRDGVKAVGLYDWLEIVGEGDGLTGLPGLSYNAWRWPVGPATVRVAGTFGWTTTPFDIKRAVAVLVWDHFRQKRGDMVYASRVSTADRTVEYPAPDPSNGVFTAMPEVDAILQTYQRAALLGVG